MRIAVTGTHGSGKTTLVDDFHSVHRDYALELEPYWALAQQGVVFADGPSIPDLEDQLAWSTRMLIERIGDANVIFDRCPLDFIAYLEALTERQGYEWSPSGEQLRKIEQAMATLDLVVFLPLSKPDEIDVAIEHPKLRRAVDTRLRQLIEDDPVGVFAAGGPRLVELRGTRSNRLRGLESAIASASIE